jgi:hypothetical protein
MPIRQLILGLLVLAAARNAAAFEGVTFSVSSDLLASITDKAERTKPASRPKITLPGILFEHPLEIRPTPGASQTSLPDVLARDYAANLSGNPDRIVENFLPGDRAALRKLFANPAVVDANTKFFNALDGMTLDGVVTLRGHPVAIVTYLLPGERKLRMVSPMLVVDGRFYRTNALKDDPVFGFVLTAVRNGAISGESR